MNFGSSQLPSTKNSAQLLALQLGVTTAILPFTLQRSLSVSDLPRVTEPVKAE